jgi:hypothetical protein
MHTAVQLTSYSKIQVQLFVDDIATQTSLPHIKLTHAPQTPDRMRYAHFTNIYNNESKFWFDSGSID